MPTLHHRVPGHRHYVGLPFMGLQLVAGIPDICVFIDGIFQFDDRHGQAIDKNHHVRAALQLAALHRKLVNGQKLVRYTF